MHKTQRITDEELVAGCVNNDRRFQEALYRKYFASMMRMCMRYTEDRNTAMDIINNGFMRVFKKIESYSFKGSLEGWIRRIVYHSLSEYFKQHNRYVQFMVFEERDSSVAEEALENIYAEDILKIVDTLPPATKRVFQLYAIEGFSHVEIAKKVNISVGTSKWHLASARKKLQLLLGNTNTYNLYAG